MVSKGIKELELKELKVLEEIVKKEFNKTFGLNGSSYPKTNNMNVNSNKIESLRKILSAISSQKRLQSIVNERW